MTRNLLVWFIALQVGPPLVAAAAYGPDMLRTVFIAVTWVVGVGTVFGVAHAELIRRASTSAKLALPQSEPLVPQGPVDEGILEYERDLARRGFAEVDELDSRVADALERGDIETIHAIACACLAEKREAVADRLMIWDTSD